MGVDGQSTGPPRPGLGFRDASSTALFSYITDAHPKGPIDFSVFEQDTLLDSKRYGLGYKYPRPQEGMRPILPYRLGQ
uniref:Uncharacterized protein n=1 Tax=Cannabis sativa TaxID=3483 RepID=A0A803NN38_CANSA